MFKWYVLNYNINQKKIEQWNIFENINVSKNCLEAVKEYIKHPSEYVYHDYDNNETKGFDGLCAKFQSILRCELWARREYEISVGDAFIPDVKDFASMINTYISEGKTLQDLSNDINVKANKKYYNLEKYDVYKQCEQNIPAIVRECIFQYKQNNKSKKGSK